MFQKEVYKNRRQQLANGTLSGVVLIVGNFDSPMNYPSNTYRFRQDSSFLYFFGIDSPSLIGLIDLDLGRSILAGNDPSLDDMIWEGPVETVREMAEKSGVDEYKSLEQIRNLILDAQSKKRKIHYFPQYRAENRIYISELLGIPLEQVNNCASIELVGAAVNMRSKKEPCELEEIRKACRIGYDMHLFAMKNALPGITEKELAGRIEGIALSQGANISFPVILTQKGEVLHQHHPGGNLEKGKLLLVDAGAESTLHYASDYTRTTPVGHRFSQQQREIYEIVLQANNKVLSLIKPGLRYLDIHLEAARVIADGLKQLGLMKDDTEEAVKNGAHALFFPHGIGHLMGLDVHDMEDYGQINVGFDEETRPQSQFGLANLRFGRRLREGFVLTVEPGIYFIPPLIEKWQSEKCWEQYINFDKIKSYLGFGGIRIEDDVVVTSTGHELLGKRLPVSVEEF